jgi:tripartite-type tricarboxylate transporter receptor subunit TctC
MQRLVISLSRGAIALICCTLFAITNANNSALALEYPTHPARIIVGYPPGGSTDILARIFGQYLTEKLGQQFIVENKPGAGNNIGTEAAAKAAPDGYTFLLVNPANTINASLYKHLNFVFLNDIDPVAGFIRVPNVMEVNPNVPANTVAEFIAYAKANPDKVNIASSGNGTSIHLCGELFKRMTGIEMTHVPYRGSAPALNDLIPGRVDVMFDNVSSILPQVRGGNVRGLAVTTANRVPAVPELPTIAEAGVPGFDVSSWFAFFAPARTPKQIIDKMNADTVASLSHPAVRGRLEELGAALVGSSPAQLAAHLKSEMDKWGPVIRDARIKIDG